MVQSILTTLLIVFIGYTVLSKYIKLFLSTKDSKNPVYSKLNLINISDRLNTMVDKHGEDTKYDEEIGRLGDQYKFMLQTNVDVINGKKTIEEAWEEEDKLKEKGIFKTNSYL